MHGLWNLLAAPFLHLRLVVKHVHMRWTTVHEQINDSLGLGGKVGQPANGGLLHAETIAFQKRTKGKRTDAKR